MFWDIILILGMLLMAFFLLWNSFLIFHDRNKDWTDKATGFQMHGNTPRENREAVGGLISGGFILFLIIFSYINS